MSDTVYAIASGKGGVGKTTTAINLGATLADRGHAVVVVDTDLGMANLAGFLDFEIETPTLHDVLAGEANHAEAIYGAPGDIDVLPSGTDIEAFAKSNPANLKHVVADLREVYDYVLLDTGAGVSYDTLVPLALADGVLLVATPDVASVRDTAKTGELAERVDSEVTGAVLTQRSSDILNADDVEETLGTDVLAVIPKDEAVPMGIDAGRPLASFAPNAPAGKAYRDLAAVLTGESDPDPELKAVTDEESEADPESEDSDPESEDSDPELAETDAPDDPLSADAAQNVRDAIGGESDALFADETGDATAGDAATGDTATGPTDESSTEGRSSDGVSGSDDGLGGSDEARSVDDLINEHISDDRLEEGSNGGTEDPLDGIEDDLGGGDAELLDGDDSGGGEARTEDPFADVADRERSEGDDGERSDGTAEPGASDEWEPPESRGGDTADEDEMPDVGAVPFEDDGTAEPRTATQNGPGTGADSDVETRAAGTGPDSAAEGGRHDSSGSTDFDPLDSADAGRSESARFESAESADADPSESTDSSDTSDASGPPGTDSSDEEVFEDDGSDSGDSDEGGGGVLGRIGSLFR